MSKTKSLLMHQSAAQAASELSDVHALVQSQVDAGMCRDEVVEALCSSWAQRLAGLSHCSQGDKARLTSALAAGPWNETQRKELARAVLVGLPEATTKKKRPNQKCTFFENFVPEGIWVKLKDTTQYSQLTRASLVAGVAHSIGIECPDQPTLYRMVSIVAYCEKNYDMGQDEVHKLMDKIQGFIKGLSRVAEIPYIEHYPCSAQELPNSIKDRAYAPGELPVEVDISELNIVLGDNKMRGRKKDRVPDWLQHVPEAYRGVVMQQVLAAKRRRVGFSMDSMLLTEPVEPAQPTPLPSAHLLRGTSKPAQPPGQLAYGHGELGGHKAGLATMPEDRKDLPITNSIKADSPEAGPPKAGPSTSVSVEDLENALLAGLKGKGTSESPETDPEVGSQAVRKKPAAGLILKRPASHMMPDASNIDMSGIFAKLRARKGKVCRNVFTSQAYHSAKVMAVNSGFSAEQAKAIARDAFGKAGVLFDED